jgi:hypothetical protein
MQWQAIAVSGSAAISYRAAPHWQPPVNGKLGQGIKPPPAWR